MNNPDVFVNFVVRNKINPERPGLYLRPQMYPGCNLNRVLSTHYRGHAYSFETN